ncbi:MAG: AtpZ/AtpI family protein [Alphaproteobacteria bacterium]
MNEPQTMQNNEPNNFEERLNTANQRDSSDQTRNRYTKAVHKSTNPNHNRLLGITSELLGGLFVGLGFGYMLDYFLGTKPIFLAIMTPFGAFIGLYNVYRLILKTPSSPSLPQETKNETSHEKKIDES